MGGPKHAHNKRKVEAILKINKITVTIYVLLLELPVKSGMIMDRPSQNSTGTIT